MHIILNIKIRIFYASCGTVFGIIAHRHQKIFSHTRLRNLRDQFLHETEVSPRVLVVLTIELVDQVLDETLKCLAR